MQTQSGKFQTCACAFARTPVEAVSIPHDRRTDLVALRAGTSFLLAGTGAFDGARGSRIDVLGRSAWRRLEGSESVWPST